MWDISSLGCIEEFNMTIIDLLKALKEENVSDIFLTEEKAPMVRRHGEIEKFTEDTLSKDDFMVFFEEHLPLGTWENLSKQRDLDLGLSVSIDESDD